LNGLARPGLQHRLMSWRHMRVVQPGQATTRPTAAGAARVVLTCICTSTQRHLRLQAAAAAATKAAQAGTASSSSTGGCRACPPRRCPPPKQRPPRSLAWARRSCRRTGRTPHTPPGRLCSPRPPGERRAPCIAAALRAMCMRSACHGLIGHAGCMRQSDCHQAADRHCHCCVANVLSRHHKLAPFSLWLEQTCRHVAAELGLGKCRHRVFAPSSGGGGEADGRHCQNHSECRLHAAPGGQRTPSQVPSRASDGALLRPPHWSNSASGPGGHAGAAAESQQDSLSCRG